jgi:hypothetical protein
MTQHAAHDPRVCDSKDPKPTKSLWTWSDHPTLRHGTFESG